MAKTAAERQAKYRKGRGFAGENGETRINTWVSTKAGCALGRLAFRYGVTKREMLEKLLIDADDKILATLDFGTPELDAYLEKRPVTQ